MKGSLTVEAAWIFPFSFLIIGLVCCLGIYEYDRAILKMTGYECILEKIDSAESGKGTANQDFTDYLIETALNRTLALKNLEAEVKMTNTNISVTYCAEQDFFEIPMEVTVVYEKSFPEIFLRLL